MGEDFVPTELSDRDKGRINRRFAKLIPKRRSGFFSFLSGYKPVSRLELEKILVDNHLIKNGVNPDKAVEEALTRDYDMREDGSVGVGVYCFKEIENERGEKLYIFTRHSCFSNF